MIPTKTRLQYANGYLELGMKRGIGGDREHHGRGPNEPGGDVVSDEDVPPG